MKQRGDWAKARGPELGPGGEKEEEKTRRAEGGREGWKGRAKTNERKEEGYY